MRFSALLVLGLVVTGCAAAPRGKVWDAARQMPAEDTTVASALVFDPPLPMDQPPLPLGREQRQRSAYVGFDQVIVTFFYLRMDDRQTSDSQTRFERRAITEKVSVGYR